MPVTIIIISVCILLILSLKKISPFISLLFVSVFAGLSTGMQGEAVIKSIEKGVGDTLGSLAVILCIGAMLGKMLETSGAIQQIAETLISKAGKKKLHWMIMLTGIVVGIPLFYNAGFVILVPLIFSIAAQSNLPLLTVAIPMAASLSVTHGFLPPHPGPVALALLYKASLTKTFLYGFLVSLPVVFIAGRLVIPFVNKMKPIENKNNNSLNVVTNPPVFSVSLFIALLPVIIITGSSIMLGFLSRTTFLFSFCKFISAPEIALLLSLFVSVYTLGIKRKSAISEIMKQLTSAVESIAMIMMIIAAGGAFKQVIIDSGAGDYITNIMSNVSLSPLLLVWMIAALLRLTIGSATVAGVTAAGIAAPLVIATHASPELMVLSTGAGSLFGSHVNDTGFWMFKEYFGLSIKQTFLSWTLMETIISVTGLLMVLVINGVIN